MSSKKAADRRRESEKGEKGKEATVKETIEHRAEERARERHAFNGTAERRSLFTAAHLCSQKETVRRDRKGEKEGG